jgi:hypothetical protein
MINKTKSQEVSELSSVKSWDDAIAFAQAKIRELKKAVAGFEAAKTRGDVWPAAEDSATRN